VARIREKFGFVAPAVGGNKPHCDLLTVVFRLGYAAQTMERARACAVDTFPRESAHSPFGQAQGKQDSSRPKRAMARRCCTRAPQLWEQ